MLALVLVRCVCVVAPHRWEHTRLGACHASFSFLSLVPQQRLDVAKSPTASSLCSTASWCIRGFVCGRHAAAAAAAAGDDVDANYACVASGVT